MAIANRYTCLIEAFIVVAFPLVALSSTPGPCPGGHGSRACLGENDDMVLLQATSVVEKRAQSDVAADMKMGTHRKSSLMSHKLESGTIREHAYDKSFDSSGFAGKYRTKEGTATRLNPKMWGAVLVALGIAAIGFSVRSIARTKAEIGAIQSMWEAETDAQSLKDASAAGELPSVVIIKGVLSADGPNVMPAAPAIVGLSEHVNEIEQPDNALVGIARMVKRGDDQGQFSSVIEKQTGLKAEDIPEVEDDFTNRTANYQEGPCVLAEALVARLGVMTYKIKKEDESNQSARRNNRIEVRRAEKKHSYNVFHARRFAEGLHILDAKKQRIALELPEANTVKMVGLGEQPSLFLATADALSEFSNCLRKEGLTVQGQHIDLSKMPPTQVSEPATMLSKFIFMDVQSRNDLGLMPSENPLGKIAAHYGRDGANEFLWEPKGFYDYETEVPQRATYNKRELVTAEEMFERAKKAAEENPQITEFCEPTFTREEIRNRRDQENCFRFTELAIPRGSEVTILARPEPDGKGGFKLVPPSDAENGRDSNDPEAERYRLRILKGHTVENLIKQRNVNLMTYYGLAVVGAFLVLGGGGSLVVSFVD